MLQQVDEEPTQSRAEACDDPTQTNEPRSRVEACDDPTRVNEEPSQPRTETCVDPNLRPMDREAARDDAAAHAACENTPVPPSVDGDIANPSISSGTARLCEDIAVAGIVAAEPWSADQNTSTHEENHQFSVAGIIRNSQSTGPLETTIDSVDNDATVEGARVDVDSAGDTFVRQTPSGGSMSSFLGTVLSPLPTDSREQAVDIQADGHTSETDEESGSETVAEGWENESSPDSRERACSDGDTRMENDPPTASHHSEGEGREKNSPAAVFHFSVEGTHEGNKSGPSSSRRNRKGNNSGPSTSRRNKKGSKGSRRFENRAKPHEEVRTTRTRARLNLERTTSSQSNE